MVPVLLLFAAMFLMIVTLGSLLLMHFRDHEREEQDAEEFAKKLLDRLHEMIDDRLQEIDDEGSE